MRYTIAYKTDSGRTFTHSGSAEGIVKMIRECNLQQFWSVGENKFSFKEAKKQPA